MSSSYNYNSVTSCVQTSCSEGCCNRYGYCPSYYASLMSAYYSDWTSCSISYTNVGAIVGGVIGGVVLIVLIVVLIVCLRRRNQDPMPMSAPNNPNLTVAYMGNPGTGQPPVYTNPVYTAKT